MSNKLKGVWVVGGVWECTELSLLEKHFLQKIKDLDNKDGCFANNHFFSDFFGISKGRCTQVINKLVDKKMITKSLEKKGVLVTRRVLRILNKGVKLFKHGGVKFSKLGVKDSKQEVFRKLKDSNTDKLNNTIEEYRKKEAAYQKEISSLKFTIQQLEGKESPPVKYMDSFLEVFESYQATTGQKLRLGKTDTVTINSSKYKQIVSRLKAGYTVEECNNVIILKNNEWKGNPKMESNICISTIFRPQNFEKYIDELDNQDTESAKRDSKPESLETYILKYNLQKDLDHMKKSKDFEKWNKILEAERFRLTNIAKTYDNPTFTALFLFEFCYMPLSLKLNGSTPQRKLEALERWFLKLSDWEQNKGIMRDLIMKFNKQAA